MKQVKHFLLLVILLLAAISSFAGNKPDRAEILRCVNSKTGEMQSAGYVEYYVSRDTLFISRKFSFVHVLRSSLETDKMSTNPKVNSSFVIKEQKNGWWYVVLGKPSSDTKGTYVSAIVLRNCLDVKQDATRICYDSYLYNIAKENKRQRTTGKSTINVNLMLKIL